MKNEKYYLGIDLGTSAVKLLLVNKNGAQQRSKCSYTGTGASAWLDALKTALTGIDKTALQQLGGIGLSSQVGTYITDTGHVIRWDSPAGKEELEKLKAAISREEQIEHLAMVHPDLISYPLPRLLYIKKNHPDCKEVISPKELLLRELTGQTVTDIYSWRGLCHPEKKAYAKPLLEQLGIDIQLPPLALPTDLAGQTSTAAEQYGLPQGINVYVGCNDFFAGLLGMGVWENGSVFELSGTSEHLGMITQAQMDGMFVSGPYFNGCATYGGTKSSGVSCDFAIKQFGIEDVEAQQVYRQPPVFLPYLKGERAPIYDENAKGVFFGITDQTTRQDMAYAVLEGVVFSLYHIGQALSIPQGTQIVTGGGSAGNVLMAQLKAALFDCSILKVKENDSSALGAAMLAMVGSGIFGSLQEAAKALVAYEQIAAPDSQLQSALRKRYSIYKELYYSLKDSFAHFSGSKEEKI